jgi:hypothetical protein
MDDSRAGSAGTGPPRRTGGPSAPLSGRRRIRTEAFFSSLEWECSVPTRPGSRSVTPVAKRASLTDLVGRPPVTPASQMPRT